MNNNEQKTIWRDSANQFRIVEENDPDVGKIIWIADDLEESEISFTRADLREILPILQAWFDAETGNKKASGSLTCEPIPLRETQKTPSNVNEPVCACGNRYPHDINCPQSGARRFLETGEL
jgi:hypothetical protein